MKKNNKKIVKMMNSSISDPQRKVNQNKKNPKSAQDTLPWDELYDNGIFRCGNSFSLRFFIQNINYKTKRDSEKDSAYEKYQKFLSAIPSNIIYQEFIINNPFDKNQLEKALLPRHSDDVTNREIVDDYQNIMTGIIDKCISVTSNQIIVGVISFEPKTQLDDVNILFKLYDQFEVLFLEMGSKTTLVKTIETLELLHNIYHSCDNEPFLIPDNFLQHDCKLKDYVAPSHFTFKSKMIEVGSSYSAVMFIKHISKSCDDEFLTDILDNNYKIAVSKCLKKIDKSDVFDMLKKQLEDLEMRLEKRREVNHKHGGEFIPYSLKNREEELLSVQDKLGNSNSDMFQMAVYIMASAETEEDLRELMLFVKQKALTHQVKIDILSGSLFQEKGLKSVLPFANPATNPNGAFVGQPYYILTDEVANFVPFSYRNVFDENGIYYGTNLITKAPIIIDRSNNMNGNAFYLGPSGSGKSMNVKSEAYAVLNKYPEDEFIIIDPENEYTPLAEAFDGEVIKFSPNTENHLNIFDIDLSFMDNGFNAVKLKSDFTMTLCELILGRELLSDERSVIDRCVSKMFTDYQNGKSSEMPTLTTFYNELLSINEQSAKTISSSLELYVTGSFNIFAHSTNVKYNKKFIVFDIQELGTQLKTVGLMILLELLWQRVIENKKRGVRTWVWTDEFSIMFNDNTTSSNKLYSTGEFFSMVYKRIRKYGGNAGGATQNISEVLNSKQAMTMLNNSDFLLLLSQKPTDYKIIVEQWDLTDSQAKYLNTDDVSKGLIISGKNVIPFENMIPEDSLMYKICTTKFSDLQKQVVK